MSDKNFKVKNGLDANGAVTITQPDTSTTPLTIFANTLATGSDLFQVKRPDGTVRFAVGNDGALTVKSNINFTGGNMTMYPANSGQTALIVMGQTNQSVANLIVRAGTGQSGNLQEWRDQNNNVAVSVGPDFALRGIAGGFFGTANGNIVGVNYLGVKGWAASHIPFVVQGVASQTGDLTRWVDSSANTLASVSASGGLTTAADASIHGITLGWGGGQDYHNLAFGYNALQNNTTGTINMGFGYRALQSNTTGWNNLAMGSDALVANTTGQQNTAVGAQALYSNTSGGENVAIGNWALLNGNGGWNTAVGASSMNQNSGSGFNTAVGRASLYSISTGSHNTAIGQQAAGGTTTGNSNSILGSEALISLTTGNNNIAIGRDAGRSVITGSGNIFLGYQAGYSETGSNKLYIHNSNTSTPLIGGDFSVKTLSIAGNTTITSQTASTAGLIVYGASSQSVDLQQWKNSGGTTLVRINQYGDLYVTGGRIFRGSNDFGANLNITNESNIIGITIKGHASQTANLQEWQNSSGTVLSKIDKDGNITANYGSGVYAGGGRAYMDGYGGIYTLDTLTVGSTTDRFAAGAASIIHRSNTASDITFGVKAMASQTGDLTQWRNSANGVLAKIDSSGNATFNTVYVGLGGGSQSTNIAIGGSALTSNTTGFGNLAIGYGSLQYNTAGWGNIAFGLYALQNYTGNVNTAIGYESLRNATAEGLVSIGFQALAANTTAYYNTAVGYGALKSTITGGGNTAFGSTALNNTTGTNNTAVGAFAGRYLTTGTDNVIIGQIAGQGFTTGSSNVIIGSYAAWYGTSTGSNNVFIGRDAGGSDITGGNNIVIGYNTQVSSSSVSNEITMGNSSITKFRIPGTGFISDTSKTYSTKELDLRDVSTQFTGTGTGSVGQKINLWGGYYGIGIESGRLVNYIPGVSSNYFVVKSSYGGSDLFSVSGTGNVSISSDLTVSGNLTVNGTTTNLNSTNLVIEDKNIIIADVATPTDTTADGAGITIKGATDKTLNWVQSTKSFTTSEPVIINNSSTDVPTLIVKLNTGQTSNIQEWRDHVGNVVAKIGPLYGSNIFQFDPFSYGAGSGYSSIGIGGRFISNEQRAAQSKFGVTTGEWVLGALRATDSQVGAFASSTTLPTFVIKGIESQTANLIEIKDGAGNNTFIINSANRMYQGNRAMFGTDISYPASLSLGASASLTGFVIRGAASQTANLQEWQNSSGGVLARVESSGALNISPTSTPNGYSFFILGAGSSGIITIKSTATSAHAIQLQNSSNTIVFKMDQEGRIVPSSTSSVGLIVRGIDSQTANLQEWQNSSGTVLASISSNGTVYMGSTGSANIATFYNGTSGYGAGNIAYNGTFNINGANIGFPYTSSGAVLAVNATHAGAVPLTSRAYASQSASLQQWQNSSGTVLSSFSSSGRLAINTSSDAGGRALYVVQPNGGYGAVFEGAGTVQNVSIYAASGGVGLVIAGATSQTANLQEWQNSSSTVLAKMDANGNFSAISKSFDIKHPTKENMRLRYASLEGPENGIYIRGTAVTNIIELPDYWTGLVHEDSITVSLTSVGSAQNIYVEKIEDNKVYIGGDLEKAFFTVYGERKDIDKLTVEY